MTGIQIVVEPIVNVSSEIDFIKSMTKAQTITIIFNQGLKHYQYKHDGTKDFNLQYPELVYFFGKRLIVDWSDENTISLFYDNVMKTLADAGTVTGYTTNC